jgi:hypothetical protein
LTDQKVAKMFTLMNFRRTLLVVAFAALGTAAVPSAGRADPISGNGVLGDFTGDFAYNSVTHQVSVTLTNAATTSPGGRITGFAFNIPGQLGAVTGLTYAATDPDGATFTQLGGPAFNNSVSASPYGDFDIGAALGGDLLGGGSPVPGVAIGQTGNWTFTLTGDNTFLNSLDETDFFASVSTGNTPAHQVPFLVRFRGFDNGGSDKVPGGFGDPPHGPTGDPTHTPEPATLLLFGALGGLGLLSRRSRTPATS